MTGELEVTQTSIMSLSTGLIALVQTQRVPLIAFMEKCILIHFGAKYIIVRSRNSKEGTVDTV